MKFFPLLPLLSLLGAAGCITLPAAPTRTTTTTIIRHEVSLEEINKMCFRAPHGTTLAHIGCAFFNPATVGVGGICTIYVPAKNEYEQLVEKLRLKGKQVSIEAIELHILGHEVKHCFEGDWH